MITSMHLHNYELWSSVFLDCGGIKSLAMQRKKLWLTSSLARYVFLLGVSLLGLLLQNYGDPPPLVTGQGELSIAEFGCLLGSSVSIIIVQFSSFHALAHQSCVFVNSS
jgi:hypothetical protein